MTTFCIILGSILMCAAIALIFRPIFPAAIIAYAGLCSFHFAEFDITPASLIFWGVASLIVLGIDYLLPKAVTRSTFGRGYVGIASITAMIAGMLINSAGIIIGAVAGAFLGAIAYSRTPNGRNLRFPSGRFVNFLCARGLPAVVTVSMVGIVILQSLILAGY